MTTDPTDTTATLRDQIAERLADAVENYVFANYGPLRGHGEDGEMLRGIVTRTCARYAEYFTTGVMEIVQPELDRLEQAVHDAEMGHATVSDQLGGAQDAIARVRELHSANERGDCRACVDADGIPERWADCETLRALDGEA